MRMKNPDLVSDSLKDRINSTLTRLNRSENSEKEMSSITSSSSHNRLLRNFRCTKGCRRLRFIRCIYVARVERSIKPGEPKQRGRMDVREREREFYKKKEKSSRKTREIWWYGRNVCACLRVEWSRRRPSSSSSSFSLVQCLVCVYHHYHTTLHIYTYI